MALKIWLPLNNTLANNGTSNTTVTSTNLTSSTSGKFGTCYSFNGSTSVISLTNSKFPDILNGDFTVCFWISSNDTGDRSIYFGNWSLTGSFFNIEKTSSNKIRFYWNGAPDYNGNLTIADSNWHHVAVGKSGNNVRTWLDGVLVDNYTGTFTGSIPSNATTFQIGKDARSDSTAYNGLMNDFRLYDHFLSDGEVKEISKGLALHWNCNGPSNGMPNLLKYTKVTSANQTLLKNNIGATWNNLTLTTKDGYPCYQIPSAQGPTWFYSGQWYTPLEANTTYTYSCWIYFTAAVSFTFNSLGHFQVYNANSTASDKSHEDVVASRIYEPSSIPANTWTKVRVTFTTNNLAGSYFQVYPRYNIAANTGDLYFRDCKLEKGGTPTPWCPNVSDTEYNASGFNSTIERDTSGFGRHGTLVSAFPTIEAGAPKYNCAYNYNGSINNAHYNNTTELNYLDNFSWSIWVKTNFTGSVAQYVFTVGRADAGGYGYGLTCTSATNCYLRFGNSGWNVSVTGGEWTHLAFTKSGTTIKTYKNGAIYGSYTFSGTAPTYSDGNGVGIGCFHYSSNIYPYYGSISDFRIYATCLTDADIKALYSTAASISNTGVLMAYEFIEG